MAAKNIVVADLKHKKCHIQVIAQGAEEELKIDNKKIPVYRDSDTGAYCSSETPYQTFSSLEEMGKSIAEDRA